MGSLVQPLEAERGVSPLEAFQGRIDRTRTGPLYTTGLGIVAFAMVLLPVIYIGLILFAAWGVLWHLQNDTWILSSGGGVLRLIVYLAPAVAGAILIFFMIKPFFAAQAKPLQPLALDPAQEPVLFAFVRKICDLVGAPAPCRIDVDCQVNASASLRRGLWSRDLVLTIGVPLAAGLDMRQFAGVLAHEFGHFAQGAGMRLTYTIRKVNFWFSRVVYERDQWDLKLEDSARRTDWRIAVMLHLARGCIWLSRRVLWALMHAGHAISCFMLRQMEYDADSYETKVAGSDAFEQTASRLRLLNVATQSAYEDVRQSWTSKRLPEDLPLLIGHKAGRLPVELREKLSSAAAQEKTRWFHTHPCDRDRVQQARRLNQPGVFRLHQPAAGLFANFAELSKRVTRHQYEKQFRLEFSDANLMTGEEILRESAAQEEAQAMARVFYGTVHPNLIPLLTTGELPPVAAGENALSAWQEACRNLEELRPEADKVSGECLEHQRRLSDLTAACWLTRANFRIPPEQFGLPGYATSVDKQQVAARLALDETSAALKERFGRLQPFMAVLGRRVTLALRLGHRSGSDAFKEENRPTVAELACVLAAVGAEMGVLHEIGSRLKAFGLMANNRANHADPGQVDRVVAEWASETAALLQPIQERLGRFAYPFPHARGQLTVAEYAQAERTGEAHEWVRVFLDANAHVERLFSLNYRLTGRVLALAHAAEKELAQPGST